MGEHSSNYAPRSGDGQRPIVPGFLTLTQVRQRFPDKGPSERLLRETAHRLALGRYWGKHFYLTEDEANKLMLAGSKRPPLDGRHPIKPLRYRKNDTVARALALSERLMKKR